MTDVLGFSGFGLSIFALICVIVSVSLDYWTYAELFDGAVKSYSGLWKICTDSSLVKQCSSIGGKNSHIPSFNNKAFSYFDIFLPTYCIVFFHI